MSPPPLRVVVADDESLARDHLRRLLSAEKEFELVGEASNGSEAVSLIRKHRPHVALLDIRMPGLNGFEILAELRGDVPPAVIFVTGFSEHALRAFDAQAADYLLKPFTVERFRKALKRARLRCSSESATLLAKLAEKPAPSPGRIALKCGIRTLLVSFEEIIYAAAANAACEVFTTTASMKVNESLSSLEARLPAGRFIRISRFALVNLACVLAVEPKSHGDQYLLLPNKKRLTLARTHRKKVLDHLERGT